MNGFSGAGPLGTLWSSRYTRSKRLPRISTIPVVVGNAVSADCSSGTGSRFYGETVVRSLLPKIR